MVKKLLIDNLTSGDLQRLHCSGCKNMSSGNKGLGPPGRNFVICGSKVYKVIQTKTLLYTSFEFKCTTGQQSHLNRKVI